MGDAERHTPKQPIDPARPLRDRSDGSTQDFLPDSSAGRPTATETAPSADLLLAVLRSVADGVIVLSDRSELLFANAAAAGALGAASVKELLATPMAEVLGRFDILDEAGQPFPIGALPGRRALLGEEHTEALIRFRIRASGEERWALVRAQPVRDEQGLVRFSVSTFGDVTRSKRIEQGRRFLAEAGELLASSLDYEATLATVARLAVPALADWCAVDLLGEEGSVRRLAVAHTDPARVALAYELQSRYPDDPQASYGVPNVLRTGKAELYPDISDAMLADSARDPEHLRLLRELQLTSGMILPLIGRGRTLGALSFVASESRRRFNQQDLDLAEELARRAALAIDNARLYREAQEAVSARDEFLASVSHDLQTPLTGIKTQAQVLLRRLGRTGQLDQVQASESLQRIDATADRMALQIGELLDVARLQVGRPLDLEIRPTDLAAMLRQVAEQCQQGTEAHQLRVQTEERELVARVDAVRLRRVVENLLDNAIKYSPDGGEILVGLSREAGPSGQWAVLRVRDFGLGIPAADLGRVFERYQRGRNVVGRIAGTGIGLAGARQVVGQHQGTIDVESLEGVGSTFTIRLPLDGPRDSPTPA